MIVELDAVVLRGVMGGGHHRPEVEPMEANQVRDGRGRQHTDQGDLAARLGEPSGAGDRECRAR
jgi:hypothetical protein